MSCQHIVTSIISHRVLEFQPSIDAWNICLAAVETSKEDEIIFKPSTVHQFLLGGSNKCINLDHHPKIWWNLKVYMFRNIWSHQPDFYTWNIWSSSWPFSSQGAARPPSPLNFVFQPGHVMPRWDHGKRWVAEQKTVNMGIEPAQLWISRAEKCEWGVRNNPVGRSLKWGRVPFGNLTRLESSDLFQVFLYQRLICPTMSYCRVDLRRRRDNEAHQQEPATNKIAVAHTYTYLNKRPQGFVPWSVQPTRIGYPQKLYICSCILSCFLPSRNTFDWRISPSFFVLHPQHSEGFTCESLSSSPCTFSWVSKPHEPRCWHWMAISSIYGYLMISMAIFEALNPFKPPGKTPWASHVLPMLGSLIGQCLVGLDGVKSPGHLMSFDALWSHWFWCFFKKMII